MEQLDLIPNSKNDRCMQCPYWDKDFKVCNRMRFEERILREKYKRPKITVWCQDEDKKN